MKDHIGLHKWWNRPLENPTQTMYMRFLKSPEGKFGSMYEKSEEEWKNRFENEIKTIYTDLWRGEEL